MTSGWVDLFGARNKGGFRPAKVTAIATFGEGLVVGSKGGGVLMWTGPGTNSDPSTWKRQLEGTA